MRPPPLSLYVHLPWCEKKCPYCDFNSHEIAIIPEQEYVDALIVDLHQELAQESRSLHSVFIGGGTPSLFSVAAIDRLMRAIRDSGQLLPTAEITMEANPGSVESDRLQGYANAGVTRFSLGIQSFDDESLGALGRVHNGCAARAAVRAASQSGADSYNLDLMHGLPGQDAASGLADIQSAIGSGAAHLSWYQLTIEPNTRFFSAPPTLPTEDILGNLEAQGSALLVAAGYRRYEISAWCQPGAECQHNLNYWEFGDYLAIGAGAHGKCSDDDGRIVRYSKTRKPDDYLDHEGTSRRGLRLLGKADKTGEFMLNALRLSSGFTSELFEARTNLQASDIQSTIKELEDQGLLECEAGRIRASDLGWRFLDDVVGRFF